MMIETLARQGRRDCSLFITAFAYCFTLVFAALDLAPIFVVDAGDRAPVPEELRRTLAPASRIRETVRRSTAAHFSDVCPVISIRVLIDPPEHDWPAAGDRSGLSFVRKGDGVRPLWIG